MRNYNASGIPFTPYGAFGILRVFSMRVFVKRKTQKHVHRDPVLTHELFDFLSLFSHQLRTPLSVVKGYVAMLLDGTFGKLAREQRDAFEKIYTANERMIRLVNNFLDMPRIHMGTMAFAFKKMPLPDLLGRAVFEARLQADIKNLSITLALPKRHAPDILADEENLLQAISNILDNAIKYTEKGGVSIFLSHAPGGMRVTIRDTGAGIAKKDLPRIFTKYVRGEDMREAYREGRGLGLYIAKQIVEGHGGKIWAESAGRGKGSAFFIELPCSSMKIRSTKPGTRNKPGKYRAGSSTVS